MNTANAINEKKPVEVSERAIWQRVNRALARKGEKLRRARSFEPSVGDVFVVDVNYGCLISSHVNVERLARELGVLRPSEIVVEAA